MYILFFKPIFSWKHLFTKPFKWVIRFFSQSKFHHAGYTIKKHGITYVCEAIHPKYRNIPIEQSIRDQQSKVYAYKVIKPYDKKKLIDLQKKLLGKKFDITGAIYSEVHKIPILRNLFKRSDRDQKFFCSEAVLYTLIKIKLLKKPKNKNHYSPQELLEVLLDNKVINPTPIIWDENSF